MIIAIFFSLEIANELMGGSPKNININGITKEILQVKK